MVKDFDDEDEKETETSKERRIRLTKEEKKKIATKQEQMDAEEEQLLADGKAYATTDLKHVEILQAAGIPIISIKDQGAYRGPVNSQKRVKRITFKVDLAEAEQIIEANEEANQSEDKKEINRLMKVIESLTGDKKKEPKIKEAIEGVKKQAKKGKK